MTNQKTFRFCCKCKKPKYPHHFHKDRTRKYGYAYTCKECEKIHNANWYQANKESKVAHARKRRALKLLINEIFTRADQTYTQDRFQGECFNCGATNNIHLDHHYPLSKGYALTRSNAVLLCKSCNSSKSAKLPEEYYTPHQLEALDWLGIRS